MNPKLAAEYRKQRAKDPHIKAAHAFRIAQVLTVEPTYRIGETYLIDGFEVEIETEYDDNPDLVTEEYGRFSNHWKPGAIDRWARDYGMRESTWTGMARRIRKIPGYRIEPWRFQDPAYCLSGNYHRMRYLIPEGNYQEQFDYLIAAKYGKTEADLLARASIKKDIERLEDACSDYPSWNAVGIVVKAKREGLVLGTASMWGFESDDTYLDQAITDYGLVEQAVDEAKGMVERLCLAGVSA